MIRCFLLILGIILVGCSAVTDVPLSPPSVTSTLLPTVSFTLSPLPPTLTPFPLHTDPKTPTGIAAQTLTETPDGSITGIHTDTLISWSYVFPIQPSSVADFAEDTASHGFPATDIFAPEGTKFVAVTNGMVDFVSDEDRWDPDHDDPALRGGISVAIIGEDGVRYYGSHLSAIRLGIVPGVRVAAGQLLGYIGHTGNARTTPSHVHFGISHPTYPEDWQTRRGEVDPFPLLIAWRGGHNVTPPLPMP